MHPGDTPAAIVLLDEQTAEGVRWEKGVYVFEVKDLEPIQLHHYGE